MSTDLRAAIDAAVEACGFTGAVRIDRAGETVLATAYGFADRANRIPNTVDTRFGVASGSKALTAVAALSLVADGTWSLGTTARSLLGDDLPLIDDAVTVEHLLSHRSGIGDYFDEDRPGEITDHVLPVPVHRLDTTEAFLAVLDGLPQVSPPGERFAYNNGGLVVLGLIAGRAAGLPYTELVQQRVLDPAGLADTGFPRTDEPVAGIAIGYLDATGPRTNIFHLPVVAAGDGGAVTTLADVHRFWAALLDGTLLPAELVAAAVRPHGATESGRWRYGLGLWLDGDGPGISVEGYDAGVSFRSRHDPTTGDTWSVVSNWSDGAWPVVDAVADAATGGLGGGQ